MPLDGIFLKGLVDELSKEAVGAKIERVQQPARGTLLFEMKGQRRFSLFAGGSTGAARVNLTSQEYEKPIEPPMFCMLLRKHLIGARVLAISQPGFERVVEIKMAAPGMFGEGEERRLIIELLGRTANIVLTDGSGLITDCLYRVGAVGEKRMVLPGMFYKLPPPQSKSDITDLDEYSVREALENSGETELDRALLRSFLGISPLVARELSFRAYGSCDVRVGECVEKDGLSGISEQLIELGRAIVKEKLKPYMLTGPDGVPFDFSYMPILQYGPQYSLTEMDSFSTLLENFNGERDQQERRRQRARELTKTVQTARDRVARRTAAQESELEKTLNREYLRECGDIITSNLHLMRKGMDVLRAYDFYSEEGREREIRLDPLKTPQQNAAKYYKDYARAKSAQSHLTERISAGRDELEYLDSVLEELGRAENARELSEIRRELISCGYVRESKQGKKEKRQAEKPMRFRSTSGMEIRAGRNNLENDALTLKNSAKTDMWLHAQKIHGSHVVISCAGVEPDEDTLRQAASIAAWFSQGRESGRVPVDYTLIKYVKKPSGARPGMVIYTDQKTIYAKPDAELVEKLRV